VGACLKWSDLTHPRRFSGAAPGQANGAAPNPKDTLETALHDLVCAHRMSLADAQNTIATDWVGAYRQVLGTAPTAP
jgi:hypothetical protein